MDYFKYATSMDIKVIQESELDFPAVTICNLNNFRYGIQAQHRSLSNKRKQNLYKNVYFQKSVANV